MKHPCRWLVGVLYRVEAKYPSSFRFSAETLVREHHKPPAQVSVVTRFDAPMIT